MEQPKFLFGDTVVVHGQTIGIILKTWHNMRHDTYYYKVYNRMTDEIQEIQEYDIERYRVRHKYLSEEELEWQNS